MRLWLLLRLGISVTRSSFCDNLVLERSLSTHGTHSVGTCFIIIGSHISVHGSVIGKHSSVRCFLDLRILHSASLRWWLLGTCNIYSFQRENIVTLTSSEIDNLLLFFTHAQDTTHWVNEVSVNRTNSLVVILILVLGLFSCRLWWLKGTVIVQKWIEVFLFNSHIHRVGSSLGIHTLSCRKVRHATHRFTLAWIHRESNFLVSHAWWS
jgi:hypothetical protein